MGDSVAVQLAPGVNPVTVVVKGVDSEAEPLAGEGVPVVQETLTLTEAALLSEKSLWTVKVAVFRLFVIVHEPADSGAEQLPVDV